MKNEIFVEIKLTEFFYVGNKSSLIQFYNTIYKESKM